MPRKQRFKPSRKPKPIEGPLVEAARSSDAGTRNSDTNIEATRPYESDRRDEDIETGQAMRTQSSSSAVIEETS